LELGCRGKRIIAMISRTVIVIGNRKCPPEANGFDLDIDRTIRRFTAGGVEFSLR